MKLEHQYSYQKQDKVILKVCYQLYMLLDDLV